MPKSCAHLLERSAGLRGPAGRELVERIEDLVGETHFVDQGVIRLAQSFPHVPLGMPDRRRFMKLAAGLAAVTSLGMLSCTTPLVDHRGERFTRWQDHLLKYDLIRGPRLLADPLSGQEISFKYLASLGVKFAGLGARVLHAPGPRTEEILPGSFLYSLMLEVYSRTSTQGFIGMLPIVHPMLADHYRRANPNVQF